jgi:hypothetical protein
MPNPVLTANWVCSSSLTRRSIATKSLAGCAIKASSCWRSAWYLSCGLTSMPTLQPHIRRTWDAAEIFYGRYRGNWKALSGPQVRPDQAGFLIQTWLYPSVDGDRSDDLESSASSLARRCRGISQTARPVSERTYGFLCVGPSSGPLKKKNPPKRVFRLAHRAISPCANRR